MIKRLRRQTIDEEGLAHLEPSSVSVPTGHDSATVDRAEQDIRNVIIFGECGVGKSSLINLLAGERVSDTSSGALGCTLEYKRHVLKLDGQLIALWDTAGLDEGSHGAVPAEKAETYLKQLLHELSKKDGVDLLVYCVRGTRVRAALLTNYHIFYSAICRKKVPIAIVITGLENQEGSMEMWWLRNYPQFAKLKMYFDDHACVTTLQSAIDNPILKERREISRKAVLKLITSTCRAQRWKPQERSWIESASSDIRAMLSTRDGYSARLPTIIMCDASRDCPENASTKKRSITFKNPIAISLSLNPFSFRNPVSISNDASWNNLPFQEDNKCTPQRVFHVYQVPRKQVSSEAEEDARKVMIVKRGADLLIFCVDIEESVSVAKIQWEHFHYTYGGDLAPQIVVVIGAPNQVAAEKWWMDVVDGTPAKNEVVAYLPMKIKTPRDDISRKRLQDLIHDRCIDCGKVSSTKNEKLFRRSLHLDMPNLTTLWSKSENNGEADVPVGEDVLTKAAVWNEPPESDSPTLVTPMTVRDPHKFPFSPDAFLSSSYD